MVIAIIGLPATIHEKILPVLPNPVTSRESMMEPTDPLSLTFKVTNDGWLSARNLEAICFQLESDYPGIKDNVFTGGKYARTLSLRYHTSIPVECGVRFESPQTKFDLAIIVEYDGLLGGRRTECSRDVYYRGAWRDASCADVEQRIEPVLRMRGRPRPTQ